MAYSADNHVGPKNVAAGVATSDVSRWFNITDSGSRKIIVKLVATATAVTGSLTAKLQTSIGSDWVDAKTVAITADGIYYITLIDTKSADQTYLPLMCKGRIVIVGTNSADTTTLTEIQVLQGQ